MPKSVLVEKRIQKEGENPIYEKHVLAELRRVNHFFDDFCTIPYFKLIQLQIETTIHKTLFGVYFMTIRSLVVVL